MTDGSSAPPAQSLRARLSPLHGPLVWYLVALNGLVAWYFLRCPIVPGDTDLWFHLDAGRYLFQHRALPHDTYYSFLLPPRPWVDYAWLFQALIYGIYSWAGYVGLVIFRAAVFGGTLWALLRYLRRGLASSAASGWLATVFTLACLILLPRYLLIRPHMFSYLFMVVFLYGLEFRPRWAMGLPLLAIVWCNLHGVAFLSLLMITGAYVAEYFVARVHHQPSPPAMARTRLVPAVLSMAAVYVTPHGLKLLSLPLQSLSYVSQFVSELQPVALPITLEQLVSFRLSGLTPDFPTLFNVTLLLAAVAVGVSLVRRQARLSHLLLVAGGAVLLTRGGRFMVEFVLLSVPILAANPLSVRLPPSKWTTPVAALISGALMVMPVNVLRTVFRHRPRFPFAGETLPEGVVAFLTRVDVGGRILNPLNPGGYLRWMLYPRYTIFMDMEFPYPFSDEDFHIGQYVFQNPELLKGILSQYAPVGVIAPATLPSFKEAIKDLPDFAVVFFDDTSVLYLNRRAHPALVSRYEITDVDPYQLVSQEAEPTLKAYDHERLMQRLAVILSMHPGCGIANYLAAMVYQEDHAYDRMIPHAQAIMRAYPSSPRGYWVMGEALRGLGATDQAMRSYRLAFARSSLGERKWLYKSMGLALRDQREFRRAYDMLKKSIDVFSSDATLEELYQLGTTALLAGRPKEAEAVFVYMMDYRLDPKDAAWWKRLQPWVKRSATARVP